MGKRTVCLKAHSPVSGDIVVEEVEVDESEIYRRLIFLKNPNVIQSECSLKKGEVSERILCLIHICIFSLITLGLYKFYFSCS